MERISINPDRLRWACEDRGISPAELADAVSTAAGTITRVFAGEYGLTFGQLRNIAKFFNRGVLFFVENDPVKEATLRTPQFRTLANQKPDLSPDMRSLIERAEQHRDIYLGLREDMDAEDRDGFDAPRVSGLTPDRVAVVVRTWLRVGDQNNFDSYRRAVEARGILVFMAVGYAGEWRLPANSQVAGFCIYDPRCPVILVKKQRVEARQVFTLMHELGHILLHRDSMIDDEADFFLRHGREHEANEFAGHLLVPDAFLEQIDDASQPDQPSLIDNWLKTWRKKLGVSSEVILIRLLETGRFDRKSYEAYRKWRASLPVVDTDSGNRSFRHREPIHLFGKKYVRTVLDAMSADRISLNKASGFLDNLRVSDIHKLEGYLASV